MKQNESLHITIKDPPTIVKSLGVFTGLPDKAILPIIKEFLADDEPKDPEFINNAREECISLILSSTVLTVSVSSDIYTIKVRKNK